MDNKRKFHCSNCGKTGHAYKVCKMPVTSYGIICIQIDDNDEFISSKLQEILTTEHDRTFMDKDTTINNTDGIKYESIEDSKLFYLFQNKIKFLMIKRKHSFGYLEFVRGRYDLNNADSIIYLFKQMTQEEINRLGELSFEDIWNKTWNNTKNDKSYKYKKEYIVSYNKFESLKKREENNLDYYIKNIEPVFSHTEWGFPKGRRNFYETNIDCATREFEEETGIPIDDYVILNKIKPINEKIIGTNNVEYRHIYYPAMSIKNIIPLINPNNNLQSDEIGDIGFFICDEALNIIRPYHVDKKNILLKLYMYIINTIVDIIKNNNQIKSSESNEAKSSESCG